MERPDSKTISTIPVVHRRLISNPKTTGGYYPERLAKSSTPNNQSPGTLLLIHSRDKYDTPEGFGATAPSRLSAPPPLLAHNALFVSPPEPEAIPVEHREVQTSPPPLFKREMESLNDYQSWIGQNIDPILKVFVGLVSFLITLIDSPRSCV